MLRLSILLALIVLAGCVTQPAGEKAKAVRSQNILAPESLLKGGAKRVPITVTRDSGLFGSGCYARIYVNGTAVADLSQSETVTVYERPGYTVLGVGSLGLCAMAEITETSVETEVGRAWKYRVTLRPNDPAFKITPTAF